MSLIGYSDECSMNQNSDNIEAITISADSITGTIQTVSQPNITSVGNLTGLTAGNLTISGGDLYKTSHPSNKIAFAGNNSVAMDASGVNMMLISGNYKVKNTSSLTIIKNNNINLDGNVGLGTENPTSTLHIVNDTPNIIISNTAETESGITFEDNSAPTSQHFKINFDAALQDLIIKSDDTEAIRINSDGVVNITNSIKFTSLSQAPSDTQNKLYCVNGTLYFNGTALN